MRATYNRTPEYPTHPTVLGLRLGLRLGSGLGIGLGLRIGLGIRIRDWGQGLGLG